MDKSEYCQQMKKEACHVNLMLFYLLGSGRFKESKEGTVASDSSNGKDSLKMLELFGVQQSI